MEERICFRLNIADGISEIRETWTGCLCGLLKRTFIVYFVFVVVDCILWQNALIDLLFMKLDVVLQLGKIVASIEQKPVSLNDNLWRVELLSRMKAIFEWALVIDCNCQSVEDDSCYKAFWLLLMIFCYLCQCFCIVFLIHIVQKLDVLRVSAFEWAMRIVKSNLSCY